jgi:hypothetical protein
MYLVFLTSLPDGELHGHFHVQAVLSPGNEGYIHFKYPCILRL